MGEDLDIKYRKESVYRGKPVPPEEVNIKQIINCLYKEGEFLEKISKVAEWKWKQPLED